MIRALTFCLTFSFFVFPVVADPLTRSDLLSRVSAYTTHPDQPLIVVDISTQTLTLYEGLNKLSSFPVSTSKYGTGSESGSDKTPLGMHRVKRKIGAQAPSGTIFKGRVNTGRQAAIQDAPLATQNDFVTSRILWLDGLEPGINSGGDVDSFRRYIYIHGTHEEGLIGQPASHGCIRMKNADVIKLFDLIPENTLVWIRG